MYSDYNMPNTTQANENKSKEELEHNAFCPFCNSERLGVDVSILEPSATEQWMWWARHEKFMGARQ